MLKRLKKHFKYFHSHPADSVPVAVPLNKPQPLGSHTLGSTAGSGSFHMMASGSRMATGSMAWMGPGNATVAPKREDPDIADAKLHDIKEYVDKAKTLERGYLQHLVSELKWTLDHTRGVSDEDTEEALDMSLFAKLASNLIEEAEKLLTAEMVTPNQVKKLQAKISGLFEFLKTYPKDIPRRKEVEDGLIIAEDLLRKRK